MKGLGLFLVLVLNPALLFAHSYKLDSYGCHSNGKLNVYECHDGKFKDKSWTNPGGKDKMLAELAAIPPAVPPVALTGDAVLTWTPNTETDLAGYKLYWGLKAGEWQTPIDLPGQRGSLNLSGILKGATYYFSLTAYDTSGNESEKSNIVSKQF